MFDVAILHSFIIHFTIALFISSILFDLWGLRKKELKFHFAAALNLYFAASAALFSVATGLLTKNRIHFPSNLSDIFEIHQSFAFLTVISIFVLTFWRIGLRSNFPEKKELFYLSIGGAGIILMIICAYFGGQVAHFK